MARYKYQSVVRDGDGRVVASATVNVYESGGTTAADVYEAETGGSAVASVTSGSDGHFYFWVDDGDYGSDQTFRTVITKSGFTNKTYDDLNVFETDFIVEDDTSPTLGGDLDLDGNNIIYTGTTSITPTELGRLDGVTSAIQTQIDAKRALSSGAPKNAIINGNFCVSQRGSSFTSATTYTNSDDTYLLDRWILLSDGDDIVDVTPETTLGSSNVKFDIETQDKKFGFLQVIESRNSAFLTGETVSLSFKAKMGSGDTSTLLRAAVLSWDGSADSVTSDIVSAWGAEGTNPTLVANWTYENTPAALTALTSSYQTYSITGISVDTASAANVAVFIWSDDMTNAVGDLVYLTDVQLEVGSTVSSFEYRDYSSEIAMCSRYFFRYSQNSKPYLAEHFIGANQSGTQSDIGITYPVPMLGVPTFVSGSVGDWKVDATVCSAVPEEVADVNEYGCRVRFTVASGLDTGYASVISAQEGGAYLAFDAEL